MPLQFRRTALGSLVAITLLLAFHTFRERASAPHRNPNTSGGKAHTDDSTFHWRNLEQHYPITQFKRLPSGPTLNIPRIQHDFSSGESSEAKATRLERLQAVKESFIHTWDGYKTYAWMKDEVAPISGAFRNSFGGWAATLVDSLDTLWIMELRDDFELAVSGIGTISFNSSSDDEINVFETTIRYLGGFLSAYDLSGHDILLEKAIELGEMLYVAFDTPNRMPVTRWNWKSASTGALQEAGEWVLLAEIGSLSLEFTRLSQLSGDPKYFDAIQRITEQFVTQQNNTKLAGMFPIVINARRLEFTDDNTFGLGAMADSFYEYLPKEYMLLGGLSEDYRALYENAINTAKQHNFFRLLNPQNLDILVSGTIKVNHGGQELDPQGQHLACFVGGMIAIGAKIFQRTDLSIARKLVDGCIWAYESTPSGIMPETFHAVACTDDCQWNETRWHGGILDRHSESEHEVKRVIQDQRLPPGFTDIPDRRYILRPEAIEAIFILYRITGDKVLQDKAWKMFQSINDHTRTDIAHAALDDITVSHPPKADRMESFWSAETLKYFYLTFSDTDTISLDDYVFNTEAHPFKRPKANTVLA